MQSYREEEIGKRQRIFNLLAAPGRSQLLLCLRTGVTGVQALQSIFHCFTSAVTRELDQRQSSQHWNRCPHQTPASHVMDLSTMHNTSHGTWNAFSSFSLCNDSLCYLQTIFSDEATVNRSKTKRRVKISCSFPQLYG